MPADESSDLDGREWLQLAVAIPRDRQEFAKTPLHALLGARVGPLMQVRRLVI
jgi:hypothetical protein